MGLYYAIIRKNVSITLSFLHFLTFGILFEMLFLFKI